MAAFDPSVPTIVDLLRDAGWVILNCGNEFGCGRRIATQFPTFIAKYGADASSDIVRVTAKCSVCGHQGATTTAPSWAGQDKGWAAFPGEGEEVTASRIKRP